MERLETDAEPPKAREYVDAFVGSALWKEFRYSEGDIVVRGGMRGIRGARRQRARPGLRPMARDGRL